jgi:hypothetical protein
MTFNMKNAVLTLALLSATSDAFMLATPPSRTLTSTRALVQPSDLKSNLKSVRLYAKVDTDNEIDRLKIMAAKLRAEAAALEAGRAQELADAAGRAFRKFDTDQDGEISLTELKAGLEKSFKIELSEKRVHDLLADFDKSGDGKLQLDEFAGVEKFRNRLEALARDEKATAIEMAKVANREEEASKLLEARMEMINDKPPSSTDKLVSVLPYVLPLLDGLQFAGHLVGQNPDNVLSGIALAMFTLYQSVPFGGLIAYFALRSLSGNPTINRLVRFNMQQAIYVDIALFFPSLLAALSGFAAQGLGLQVPPSVGEIGSDALFFTILATIGYASVSSLLGVTPDKIPFVSKYTSDRMPSFDMFDDQGRLKPSEKDDDSEKKI